MMLVLLLAVLLEESVGSMSGRYCGSRPLFGFRFSGVLTFKGSEPLANFHFMLSERFFVFDEWISYTFDDESGALVIQEDHGGYNEFLKSFGVGLSPKKFRSNWNQATDVITSDISLPFGNKVTMLLTKEQCRLNLRSGTYRSDRISVLVDTDSETLVITADSRIPSHVVGTELKYSFDEIGSAQLMSVADGSVVDSVRLEPVPNEPAIALVFQDGSSNTSTGIVLYYK